nr:probable serine/threonine-protein kinase At1g01540 [Ipomoea batatas]
MANLARVKPEKVIDFLTRPAIVKLIMGWALKPQNWAFQMMLGRSGHPPLVALTFGVDLAIQLLLQQRTWLHGDVGPYSPLTWEIRMNIFLGCAKGYISGYKNQFQNFIKYLCEIGDEMDLLNEAEMALSQTNDPTPEVPNGIAGHYLLGLTYRCFPTSCSSN